MAHRKPHCEKKQQRNKAAAPIVSENTDTIDFTRKWEMADVALRVQDTDALLHVNKTVLAVHSPFFKALFFSQFAESMQDTVEIALTYWVTLEILRIIHHIDRHFGVSGHTLYSANELTQLYQAGDAYDIPLIRELCKQQFTQIAPKDAFEVSIQLELHTEKSEILKKMSFDDIEAYLKKGITDLVLSPADAAVIVEKCKEAEIQRIRCTNCGSTNVGQNNNRNSYNYSNGYYDCNSCRTQFHWTKKN